MPHTTPPWQQDMSRVSIHPPHLPGPNGAGRSTPTRHQHETLAATHRNHLCLGALVHSVEQEALVHSMEQEALVHSMEQEALGYSMEQEALGHSMHLQEKRRE